MSQAFFCPTVMGLSRDWADSSCSTRGVEESAGRSCLCCDPHHHPASWAFVPFFGFSQLQDLGRSSGPMPYPKAASARYIPPQSGSLERAEAEPWRHSSARSRPWSPLASGNRTCVRTCKCGCLCVRILLVSLGNLGVGLE